MAILRKYVFNEIRLKLLSLLLAAMLWFSMMYIGESQMTFSAPISFDKLHKGLVVREADTRDVLITVNGSLSVLKNVRAKDISVVLDLSKIKEGRQIINITKRDIIVPKGVKVEEVKPEFIVIATDKTMEKYLRAVVKLGDKLTGLYQIASWSPQHIYVEGPKELLEKEHSVPTFPVDGDFTEEQHVVDVPLDTRSLEPRKVRPETVRVTLKRIEK